MNLDDLDPDSPEYDAALEAAQQAADGEASASGTPADDTAGAADPAAQADPATTDTPADPEAAAAAVVDAGAADPAQPEKVAGVASKDGGRVLPYAALQTERRSARAASARADRVEREAEALRQELADLKAGKKPESDTLSDEDLAAMEENFPEQAKKVRVAMERAKAAEASAPPTTAAAPDDDIGDDPLQEAIDQVPLLVDWRHSDPEKFARAAQIDTLLQGSPKWRDKPLAERFAHAARQVADEFDIPVPQAVQAQKPSSKPATPDPRPVVDKAPRANPNTLSDFKGGAVADHGTADYGRMSPTAMLDRFSGMTDAEIDAILARG